MANVPVTFLQILVQWEYLLRVSQQESLRITMNAMYESIYRTPKHKHCLVRAAQESQSKLYMLPPLTPSSAEQTSKCNTTKT